MSRIVIVIILVLLFGGGGGYYAHGRYGGAGLGGVLGVVLIVVLALWLLALAQRYRWRGFTASQTPCRQ
jgi:hypothetical protein